MSRARAASGISPSIVMSRVISPMLPPLVSQSAQSSAWTLRGALSLREGARAGGPLAETAAAIHAQGGLVMVPDPTGAPGGPAPEALRALRGAADLHETRDPAAWEVLRRAGLVPCAGSGAERADAVGASLTEMRPATGPEAFLAAVAEARTPRPWGRRRRAPG